MPDRQWYHVAATVSGDGTLALYIRGKRVASRENDRSMDLKTLVSQAARRESSTTGSGRRTPIPTKRPMPGWPCGTRHVLQAHGLARPRKTPRLAPRSQYAADKCYFQTAARLGDGLERVLNAYANSDDPHKKQMYCIWAAIK